LGKSILRSLLGFKDTKIIVSVKSSQDQLRKEFPAPNLEIATDNQQVLSGKVVFLCVKSGQAQQVCENLQGKVDQNTIIISAMAGVPLNKIKKWLEHNLVIKIMPTIVLYNPDQLHVPQYNWGSN
jgi:pyrroline-5-carboxylate reductase